MLQLDFPPGDAVEHQLPLRNSGGVPPFTASIDGCPDWVTLFPDQGIIAGSAPAEERGRTFFCTYLITDSDIFGPNKLSYGLRLTVESSASSLSIPEDFVPNSPEDAVVSLTVERRTKVTFAAATGGVEPYTYEIIGCELPPGLRFSPDARTLSGTPLEFYRGPDCTYRVTDSALPPASFSRDFELIVDPLDRGGWRFRTRTVGESLYGVKDDGNKDTFVTLPHAVGGMGTETYELLDHRSPLQFDKVSRELSYRHTGTAPFFKTPTTFRYQVSAAGKVNDTLCIDIAYRIGHTPHDTSDPHDPHLHPGGGSNHLHVVLWVREDAYWDGTEYRCPDAPPRSPSSSGAQPSNPVHTALAPVHARRAVDVAHTAVRDRVRGWSPGDSIDASTIVPSVGLATLSGQSDGFDYTGSSESLSAGAELGAGSWQAGLVASFARTDLDYRAGADLSEHGYLAGEHNTEILSVHPFAAWHASSGGHLWASLGVGMGELRHRDDLGFPSWSRSDVRLLAYDLGASVPVADVLSGELQAEAGIESFALEITGGGNISSSLPAMRGLDYRAGLTWSAPLPGEPSISMAYKHLTGDGPEGGALDAKGSLSVAEFFHSRISLRGSAEASLGLGDYDHSLWGLGLGLSFAPDYLRRGFGLDLDTRLMSQGKDQSSDVSIRGEAGYGIWGGPLFGTVRPYMGLARYQDDNSLRRTLGLDLRDTPNSRINIEVYDHPGDRLRALDVTFRRRF